MSSDAWLAGAPSPAPLGASSDSRGTQLDAGAPNAAPQPGVPITAQRADLPTPTTAAGLAWRYGAAWACLPRLVALP
eukprot:8471661-Alexandrium_andersonii.AAC.1